MMVSFRFCFRLSTLMLTVFGLVLLSSGLDSAGAGDLTETKVNRVRTQAASKADESVRHWGREGTTSQKPIRQMLENLTPAERENTLIELELPTGMSQEVLAQAEKVEDAWNNGDYGHALYLFMELGKLMDIQQVAVGVSWKTPIETPKRQNLWGNDVRIGTRENIYNEELDFDLGTGHLFAAVLLDNAGTFRWAVNISTDGGASWSESFFWSAGHTINDIGATVVGGFFWVSYSGGTDQEFARLRRFFVADGTSDGIYGTHVLFDKDSAIEDLELCGNTDSMNNRIRYSAILNDGRLVYLWDDTGGTNFTEQATGITDAERGLDVKEINYTTTGYHMWFSFIDSDDSLTIAAARAANQPDVLLSTPTRSSTAMNTSLGGRADTVLCVYEYWTGSNLTLRTRVTYNGGAPAGV